MKESDYDGVETGLKVIDLLAPFARGGKSVCSVVQGRKDRADYGTYP